MDKVPDNVWVVVDEAYAQFADHLSLANFIRYIGKKRVMVVRTFSKFYGLAGARLGYVLSDPEAIQAYDTVTEPFNTNRTAIAGAAAAMQFDKAEIDKTRKKILGDREGLVESLGLLGFTVAPSQANFVFAKLPDGAPDATQVVDDLMKQGVIIRDCTPWGYPHHIRVTVGTHKELEFFLSKLTAVLSNL